MQSQMDRKYIGGGSPNRACVFKICVSESAVPIHHGLSHSTWALYGHEYSHVDELWVMRGTHGVWGVGSTYIDKPETSFLYS